MAELPHWASNSTSYSSGIDGPIISDGGSLVNHLGKVQKKKGRAVRPPNL